MRVFVDVMAVARGSNTKTCSFPHTMLRDVYKDELKIQRIMPQNGKSPNLQHLGLRSFLLELLVQIAALRCSASKAAVYLRAKTSSENSSIRNMVSRMRPG